MNVNTLKIKLKKASSNEDYEKIAHQLMNEKKNYFFTKKFSNNATNKYNEFLIYIAKKFHVSTKEVGIIGSGKYGFSLNPRKNFKIYDEESDIDMVIISLDLFNKFWEILFINFMLKDDLREFAFNKSFETIFKRFVDVKLSDKILASEFYSKWLEETNSYKIDLQSDYDFPSEIGYRIYRSWSDYKITLILNLKKLSKIIKGGA